MRKSCIYVFYNHIFDPIELEKVNMVNEHKILLEMFIEYMNNEKK